MGLKVIRNPDGTVVVSEISDEVSMIDLCMVCSEFLNSS